MATVARRLQLRAGVGERMLTSKLQVLNGTANRRTSLALRMLTGRIIEPLALVPEIPMLLMLARLKGIGIETADMLVHEVLSRNLRDQRALARYAGMTGAPDESGSKRREKGLARAGNARVRRGMLQLAWRWLMFQKNSALAQWYWARTANARRDTRKIMIVALARKLLIALWRYVTSGELPAGAVLRPAI